MADEPDPPRKFYQLKAREFEVVNPPLSAQPARPENQSPPPGTFDVRGLYQLANTPGPVLPVHRNPGPRNDVHVILQDNLTRANAAGLNDVVLPRKRRSKRRRDFFLVVIPLDAFFAYVALGPYSNVALMAYGLAGVILSTLGLAWIMFVVMDDY